MLHLIKVLSTVDATQHRRVFSINRISFHGLAVEHVTRSTVLPGPVVVGAARSSRADPAAVF